MSWWLVVSAKSREAIRDAIFDAWRRGEGVTDGREIAEQTGRPPKTIQTTARWMEERGELERCRNPRARNMFLWLRVGTDFRSDAVQQFVTRQAARYDATVSVHMVPTDPTPEEIASRASEIRRANLARKRQEELTPKEMEHRLWDSEIFYRV
jgi:hypothetical protein